MTQITELEQVSTVTDSLEFAVDSPEQTFNMSVGQLKNYFAQTFVNAQQAQNLGTQTGTVIMSPASDIDGFLLCDGSTVSRTTYAGLFSVIGVNFGNGDGGTTFNLPDYRGKFIRGLGANSAGLYETQSEGLPNITGTTYAQDGYLRNPANSGCFTAWTSVNGSSRTGDGGRTASYGTFSAQGSNPIYGNSQHVTPINQALNFFIKY